ncbi:MAG: hypothetical protein HN737_08595 [Desulfobacterales bacterium]|nr:hypothetical protein [Desulfobacteraceae bacterium]MBT7085651.1 hypothetical protein [Desulfobacterales bacterium]MBT7697454.1 hypothetical protein [Desulfobacterales bacterium]
MEDKTKDHADLVEENRLLRNKIALLEEAIAKNNKLKAENVRREEYKDVDFGRLLSVAIEHNTNEYNILNLMTEGTKRVVGDGVDVALYIVEDVTPEEFQVVISKRGVIQKDLVSRERVLYCLIDTEIGDKIDELEEIDRYVTLKKGTVLGDTDIYGEGVVSVSKLEGGERVKNFIYGDYSSGRFHHLDSDKYKDRNSLRVSFPIYHIETDRLDEIQYILLVRRTGNIPFSNDLVRAIRGYGNYATLALAIKQLEEKERQILEKDRLIEEQDKFIVNGVRRYLHNIVTPLSTIEYIVSSLNEIISGESDSDMSKKYSVLLAQVNKVKDSLQRIRDTITKNIYYQEKKFKSPKLIDNSVNKTLLELDGFLKEYIQTVDIKESYGSIVDFELNLGAGNRKVLIDPIKLSYILDNAIRNTYQECEAHGIMKVVFELKTLYSSKTDSIVLFLKDYAGGLSEEQYASYKSGGVIKSTKEDGTGEGIPTILEYFREMGCKDVELLNFPFNGIMYTAAFSIEKTSI